LSHPATTRVSAPAAPATPGFELSKPRRNLLSSLGHHVVRLAEACDRLRGKEATFPGLAPWLRPAAQGNSIVGDGVFACPLTLDGVRLGLHPLVASSAQCAAAFPALSLAVPESAAPLAPPASLNDPLWPALLRLRPLHDFWERELRRASVDLLFELLPDAWLLDPAPLPPGSVIPRLEVAAWADLDVTARRFVPATTEEIARSLAAYPAAPGVLTALPEFSADAIPILSFYLKAGARVDWLGAARAD
jgi:hypothetical protein